MIKVLLVILIICDCFFLIINEINIGGIYLLVEVELCLVYLLNFMFLFQFYVSIRMCVYKLRVKILGSLNISLKLMLFFRMNLVDYNQ